MSHHYIRYGKEFAEHEKMAAELKADIYFANPYHSWERGLSENSNGPLRQYFPKGMELTDLTEEQVQETVERINHRPRKVLGFRTPHEVFFGMKRCRSRISPTRVFGAGTERVQSCSGGVTNQRKTAGKDVVRGQLFAAQQYNLCW